MQMLKNEALAVIATTVEETHDGLAQFTDKLRAIDEVPAFWWGDYPVWVSDHREQRVAAWPLTYQADGRLCILCPQGDRAFLLPADALQSYVVSALGCGLSAAEFAVFTDLATGLSVEDSAMRAQVAISTRRKQLQTASRKLDVVGQAELISLANQLIGRFATVLAGLVADDASRWGGYVHHLPAGVRCAVLEGSDHNPVRYLEIGPVTGRPVIILHPMVFPHIDDADVRLFHDLGWRTLWPIRTGCLDAGGAAAKDWAVHCDAAAADIHTIQRMCAAGPVPIVALVSSGAYAVTFAERHPACVQQIDFVSTCFSSGKGKSRDVYFGDFLLRSIRQNGRLAAVAMQHLAAAVFKKDQLETTLRRIFKGSPADQVLLQADFSCPTRADRITYAVRHSIGSMRFDYLSQLKFCWSRAAALATPLQFWHGAQDHVHALDDMITFSQQIAGHPPKVAADMGHLTQGAPMRAVFRAIAATYSK